jgi:hypothetical protein
VLVGAQEIVISGRDKSNEAPFRRSVLSVHSSAKLILEQLEKSSALACGLDCHLEPPARFAPHPAPIAYCTRNPAQSSGAFPAVIVGMGVRSNRRQGPAKKGKRHVVGRTEPLLRTAGQALREGEDVVEPVPNCAPAELLRFGKLAPLFKTLDR